MMYGLKNRLLIVSALLLTLQVCLAQAPSGQLAVPIPAAVAPVWDLSGPFSFQHTTTGSDGTAVPVQFGVDLVQDARGTLRGRGVGVIQVGSQMAAGIYTAAGKVYRSGDQTRVVLSVNFFGVDNIAGARRKVVAAVKYAFVVDREALKLTGASRGSVSISGLGTSKIGGAYSIPVPAGANGSWTLKLDIAALSKIQGTAVISISRYRSPDTMPDEEVFRDLPATASGAYSRKLDAYQLRISGFGVGKGNSVIVALTPIPNSSQYQLVSLKGMLLGQKFSWAP